MSSWSKLTLFVAAAAALSPAVEGHRPLKARAFGKRAPATNKSVIIEMFEWSWDSIAAECTNFIGPAGYGFVQGMCTLACRRCTQPLTRVTRCATVNPPQEHVQGDSWWTDYQAVSYQITSKHGNRDQFANMVNTCHNAGVGVIVGTSLIPRASCHNHHGQRLWRSAQTPSGTTCPALIRGRATPDHRSQSTTTPESTRIRISIHAGMGSTTGTMPTRCRRANSLAWPSKCPGALDRKYVIAHKGIYSLATETEYVRSRLAQYGNDLLSLGVDGLRLDAAKRQSASYPLYTAY